MKVTLNMEHVKGNLGNNGVKLDIADSDGKRLGTLRIGRATVEWRKRGIRDTTPGVELTLRQLVEILESREPAPPKVARKSAPSAGTAARRSPKKLAEATSRSTGPRVPSRRGASRAGVGQDQLFDID